MPEACSGRTRSMKRSAFRLASGHASAITPRSGFDRGHMAPSGDMAPLEGQAESFSLANLVPQNPGSNRCLWEGTESAVRELALQEGESGC
ncbi:DNA/RNA non-specific endonuclease [Belnapia mucosa]